MVHVHTVGSSISALPTNAATTATRVLRGPAATRLASRGRHIATYRPTAVTTTSRAHLSRIQPQLHLKYMLFLTYLPRSPTLSN